MKKIILIGGGGHCRSCIDVIESTNEFQIIGIIDKPELQSATLLGYPVIGTDNDILSLEDKTDYFLITIGHIGFESRRKELFDFLNAKNLMCATVISPHAVIGKEVMIGKGTIVMHQAMINTGAKVGDNGIINSKALIEHDAKIGDHCHISTGAILNGEVKIGDQCFIGSHATVNLKVGIVSRTVVASNSLVTKSIKGPGIYRGIPVVSKCTDDI